MTRKRLTIGIILALFLVSGAFSQNKTDLGQTDTGQSDPNMEELLKEALTVRIQAKLFHDVQNVMWQSELEKLTIPGRPVTIHMQNEQARLSVHFTPYRKSPGGLILVAQSEIWLKEPATESSPENLRYFTSMKSIPLEYDETIYFYPLGKLENLKNPNQIHIEMVLQIYPYLIEQTLAGEPLPEVEKKGN
ncbi:hypothetical protein [Oceanispirochaeta sp.]|uniref:hypothetical protein n=1 Tax=Oceanispirochaeta sp. TaxID=2035350 RepID=UPI00262B5581|nr:hypothetical protein [Oceanispirochaeta sp.]MDA3956846.1 hypothetical protein [Oceanispirochaeta sp.]